MVLVLQVCCYLPVLEQYVYHRYSSVRHMASRVWAALATVTSVTTTVVTHLLTYLLPSVSAIDDVIKRQGAVECLRFVVDALGLQVLPYMALLIVPLLGG